MGRLTEAWRLLNMPCRGMTRLASESLDRDLGRFERVALRAHLGYCSPCRRYFRQIRALTRLLRKFADPHQADAAVTGPKLPDDVRARMKRRIRQG